MKNIKLIIIGCSVLLAHLILGAAYIIYWFAQSDPTINCTVGAVGGVGCSTALGWLLTFIFIAAVFLVAFIKSKLDGY
jgi:high-affinity Fe2+/Pb2+ permease